MGRGRRSLERALAENARLTAELAETRRQLAQREAAIVEALAAAAPRRGRPVK